MASSADMVEKVGKLLAQAEGTTNQAEAEAYTELAQKLAATYAIDLELARANQKTKEQREEPTTERIVVGESGRRFANRWWVDLMWQVTDSNDVRWTVSGDRAVMWLYGYPSDIEVSKLLFASLNAQMVGGVAHNLKTGVHKELGVHGATYRLNFYEGFIETIGMRLRRARREALLEQKQREEAAPVTPTDDAPALTGALVMVKKKERVNDYYDANNNVPKSSRRTAGYQSIQPKTLNRSAQSDGASAAHAARLSAQGALPGARTALR